jgi:hypothetical protein
VSQIIPALTEAAWREKHDDIVRVKPAVERGSFVFAYRRADFEREYGRDYQRPGVFARFLGVLYRVVPKIGPFKPLGFKAPTLEAEALFAQSFRRATSRFRAEVRDLGNHQLRLRNTDFDTGRPSRHGEYVLADDTYAELLEKLSARRFEGTPTALKRNIMAFYGESPRPSPASQSEMKHWTRVEHALRDLGQQSGSSARTRSTPSSP